jgi:hypothetical protein
MKHTIKHLEANGLVTEAFASELKTYQANKPMSIFWHIRTLMYLGVTLLATGLGTVIYKNIDTIGHITIVGIIGLLSAACFYYCFKNAVPFQPDKWVSPNTWFDYILLLGVLLFLTFEGYLQFQYNIFGDRYGTATIIPAAVIFGLAYRFDHLGLLSMGITLFASWLGITLTPKSLLMESTFSDVDAVQAGFILCAILIGAGYLGASKSFKKHFDFTYYNFGFHLGAIAVLVATFNFKLGWLWIFLIAPLVAGAFYYAKINKSFYALLCAFIYSYIAVTYLIIKGCISMGADSILWAYLLLMYFIGSSIFAIQFLRRTYKQMI